MARYKIEFTGTVWVYAESEKEALDKFEQLDYEQTAKSVEEYHVEEQKD